MYIIMFNINEFSVMQVSKGGSWQLVNGHAKQQEIVQSILTHT